MTERHRTTAQYLNGLAVAALTTAAGAFLAGHAPPIVLIASAVLSGCLHVLALYTVKGL